MNHVHREWRSYFYSGSNLVAMRVQGGTRPNLGDVFYLFGDFLGSTNLTVKSDTLALTELKYKPWGETRYENGITQTTFQYTGQRLDTTTSLYWYNSRWYDPYITQFTQPDSIIPDIYNPLDLNRYAYVRYNPVNFNDPSGHDVGCAKADNSECGSKNVVIIVCGQNERCGVNDDKMKDYYNYALDNGDQVYYINNDDYGQNKRNKYDMATDISFRINNNPDENFILAGHSAGADAVIATNMISGYANNIKASVLLEPSMEMTGKDGERQDLQDAANKIPAGKAVIVSSNSQAPKKINGNQDKRFQNDDHFGITTDRNVFIWAFKTLGIIP